MNLQRATILTARIALFVIYFWFGFLKVIGQSPASGMVETLFGKTMAHMPFMTFGIFIVLFGLFEMAIGVLFVVPGKERIALVLFFVHMFTTILPLFVMGNMVWSHMFVPTLEGQYIVKNLALIACALMIWSTIPHKVTTKTESSATI
jgi:uncharacterized membrane protein YphA (DoxX/SURF4 family)